MVRIDIEYTGDLHCEARHAPSGMSLETDAPVDNQGRGQSFSPTDLVATALGTCMATIMGIVARKNGWDIEGTRMAVDKQMTSAPPRRIDRLSSACTSTCPPAWMPTHAPCSSRPPTPAPYA
jgi:putative redox protein